MTLAHQHFTAVLLLIYGSLFLSGVFYCLSVFWCAVADSSWILHHDNAPAHTALSVRNFSASKQITVLEHPPYSQDLASNDFFLFPKMKEMLKGRHFDDIDDSSSEGHSHKTSSKIVLKGGLGAGIFA
jgi:hypothetical protein